MILTGSHKTIPTVYISAANLRPAYCLKHFIFIPSFLKTAMHNSRLKQTCFKCGAWWLIDRVNTCQPDGRGFESCSSRHVRTLGKSFTPSCLWCFGEKLRHSIRAVTEVPLSSSGLEEVL